MPKSKTLNKLLVVELSDIKPGNGQDPQQPPSSSDLTFNPRRCRFSRTLHTYFVHIQTTAVCSTSLKQKCKNENAPHYVMYHIFHFPRAFFLSTMSLEHVSSHSLSNMLFLQSCKPSLRITMAIKK